MTEIMPFEGDLKPKTVLEEKLEEVKKKLLNFEEVYFIDVLELAPLLLKDNLRFKYKETKEIIDTLNGFVVKTGTGEVLFTIEDEYTHIYVDYRGSRTDLRRFMLELFFEGVLKINPQQHKDAVNEAISIISKLLGALYKELRKEGLTDLEELPIKLMNYLNLTKPPRLIPKERVLTKDGIEYTKWIAITEKGIMVVKKTPQGDYKISDPLIEAEPLEVEAYIDPAEKTIKWRVYFKKPGSYFWVGPHEQKELYRRLKEEYSAILSKREAEDVLIRVLNYYLDQGLAKVEYVEEAPGYYLIEEEEEGKLFYKLIWNKGAHPLVKPQLPETPDMNKVKHALETIDKFIREYANEEPPQITMMALVFATPFGVIRKQLGQLQQSLIFAGQRDTYKTTIAWLGPGLIGIRYDHEAVFREGSITYPQLANGTSRHTGPFIIDDVPSDFLLKDASVIAWFKGAPQTTASRFLESDRKPRKALATPIITYNTQVAIGDPHLANLKRILLVKTENSDRIKKGGRDLILGLYNDGSIYHLGAYLRDLVTSEEMKDEILELMRKPMPEVGKELLKLLYTKVMGKAPDWLDKVLPEEKLDPSTELIEEYTNPTIAFVSVLVKHALEEFRKAPDKIKHEIESQIELGLPEGEKPSLYDYVIMAIERGLVDYVKVKKSKKGEKVVWIIAPKAVEALRKEYNLLISQADLSNALGGRLEPRKIAFENQKVIILPFSELNALLTDYFSNEEK